MSASGPNPLAYEGVRSPNPPNLIKAKRNPAATDVNHDLGTFWLNEATATEFVLVSISAGSASWDSFGGATAGVDTINGLTPAAGNIIIAATANQTAVASAGSTVTLSLPAAIVAPGSLTTTTTLAATTTVTAGTGITSTTGDITATAGDIVATAGTVSAGTTVTATLGDITATNGDLVLGTAGNKINIATGANASAGMATLVGGTITVATTAVTANSLILLTRHSIGATGAAALGLLTVGTVTAATSFVINAVTEADATTLAATDVSVVGWQIIN